MSLDWPRRLGLLSLSLGLFTIAAWMGALAWREFQLIDVYKTTRAITNGEKLTPEGVSRPRELPAIMWSRQSRGRAPLSS